jgi:hypothetical protein
MSRATTSLAMREAGRVMVLGLILAMLCLAVPIRAADRVAADAV